MAVSSNSDILYLKGVGPSRAKVLAAELGIRSVHDLLMYFPFRYIDRSARLSIADLTPDTGYAVLTGTLQNLQSVPTGPHRERLTVELSDGTGTVRLVWFAGTRWIRPKLKPNVSFVVMGKPSLFNGHWEMSHPEIELASSAAADVPQSPFLPVYNTTDRMKQNGLSSRALARLTASLVAQVEPEPENLPQSVIDRFQLIPHHQALVAIHYPQSEQQLDQARFRLKFEELFFLQLDCQYARFRRQLHSQGHVFSHVGSFFNRFYREKLPFPLTGAQKRVVREVWSDLRSGHQMNRLLQGDVGSGKTLVALLCMLLAVDNGCQACLMAPTEILATQHYHSFLSLLDGIGLNVQLLVGGLKPSEKKRVKQLLADGRVDILIGTHALIEDDVAFRSLGLVVIDEQHRFGVEQRARLWRKASPPPHVLVMTATPIPRTLAMSLYGDLDCSVIDELPPGRQPVRTLHCTEPDRPRLFHFLKRQIIQGRQVYFVFPLIHESPKVNLRHLEAGLEMIQSYFPRPQFQTSMVHGALSPADKASEMERFKQGKTHIMVATTVIEVGVDVPNATVMVIENADRFGLSQLHQLRGRVGRGGGQSWCILMTDGQLSLSSQQRIQTMCSTSDGFRIAEADLQLRGPGDVQGLQQSGVLDLRIASIVDDEPLLHDICLLVRQILSADPSLQSSPLLAQHILQSKHRLLWSNIS